MKNLIFKTVLILTFLSFTLNISAKDSWWERAWKTALVDAGGALGGAGSVASVIGAGSATPIGSAAIVGGAVLGGASASVAYSGSAGPGSTGNNSGSFGGNKYDFIGVEHNQFMHRYLTSQLISEPIDFYSFFKKTFDSRMNQKTFDILNAEYFNKQEREVKKINSKADCYDFVSSNLTEKVDIKKFMPILEEIGATKNIKEAINLCKKLEANFFEKEKLNKQGELLLKSFFSTLRHSLVYWGEKLKECPKCIIDFEDLIKPSPTFPKQIKFDRD